MKVSLTHFFSLISFPVSPEDFLENPSPNVLRFDNSSGDTLNVTVAIVDDVAFEGEESFNVMLLVSNVNVSSNDSVVNELNDLVTVTIEDNERG